MKQLRLPFACMAIFAMVFTSCSKDETLPEVNRETATLSFGAIVNDLINSREAAKQSIGEIPECSDDVPAYVTVVLSTNGVNIIGSNENPFEINLVEGQIFTEEVGELQLDPGTYSLEHFAVYNDDDEVIWIAPKTGSDLDTWVNNPLPLNIDLRAGVKKYVEVPVICFDNRNVNEYGYLFFELVPTQAVQFCFFANYCPTNSGGRHYTANYSVSVWSGTNASGTPLYANVGNITGQYDNGDYYAAPLCFALPSNDDLDEEFLYYEVTLLDWPGNYGTVAANTVISGTLSMNDIMNNFDGDNNVDYEHLRFGCGDDGGDGGTPVDADGDGVPDSEDNCPTVPGPASNNGCPETTEPVDTDGDGVTDSEDNCPTVPGPASNNGCPETTEPTDTDGDGVTDSEDDCPTVPGPASNKGCPEDTGCVYDEICQIEAAEFPCLNFTTLGTNNLTGSNLDFDFFQAGFGSGVSGIRVPETGQLIGDYVVQFNEEGLLEVVIRKVSSYTLRAYEIEVRPMDPETGKASETCREITCNSNVSLTENLPYYSTSDPEVFRNIDQNTAVFIRVTVVGCP